MSELFVPYGYVIGRRPRKRLHLHLMDETITNLIEPLTPLPILRLFRTAGTLDALASCTSLTSVDVSYTEVEGQSARALGLVALNLHCKPPGHQCKFIDTCRLFVHCLPQGRFNHSPNAPLSSHST